MFYAYNSKTSMATKAGGAIGVESSKVSKQMKKATLAFIRK